MEMRTTLALVALGIIAACAWGVDARTVSYDSRSMLFDGQRQLLLSGSLHYERIDPNDYDRVLSYAVALGLNTIETYVFWDVHMPSQENATFSGFTLGGGGGWADLSDFVRRVAAHKLNLVVRIGPYVCAEHYYGGIPLWMRHSGAQCYRCADPVFEREMERFVTLVVNEIRPQLASNGGPVIMLQIENEFNGDQKYLTWAVHMARNLTTDVPWNLCHDVKLCGAINNGQQLALCTINGFWEERRDFQNQPSPGWIEKQRSLNPEQPLYWTEDQGWFDQWGLAMRVRDPTDTIFGVARWISRGGSAHNFYMLSGGSNFGRSAGGEVITAYAPDTVIDYLLLPHQPNFDFFRRFFHVLQQVAPALLASKSIPSPSPLPNKPVSNEGTVVLSASSPSRFVFESPSMLLRDSHSGCCVALPASDTAQSPVRCLPCDASSPAQQWRYNDTSQHVETVHTFFSCLKPDSPKHAQCRRCLDVSTDALIVFDCKSPSDPMLENQRFHVDASTICSIKYTNQCLATAPPTPTNLTEAVEYNGQVAFLVNYDVHMSIVASYRNTEYPMRYHSLLIVDVATGVVLFNTSDMSTSAAREHTSTAARASPDAWEHFEEDIVACGSKSVVSENGPQEQLTLTDNLSDYLMYSTNVTDAELGSAPHVTVPGAYTGQMLYVFIDGAFVGNLSTMSAVHYGAQGVAWRHSSSASAATHTLGVYVAAMGVKNTGVAPTQGKGISGQVLLNGKNIAEDRAWRMAWFNRGETQKIYTSAGTTTVAWQPASAVPRARPLTWYRARLDRPVHKDTPDLAYALSITRMFKGTAYVNGFNIGRYFQTPSTCSGGPNGCAMTKPGLQGPVCKLFWRKDSCGVPVQHLYHIPSSMIYDKDNLVVLFEESGEQVVASGVTLVALTAHPTLD